MNQNTSSGAGAIALHIASSGAGAIALHIASSGAGAWSILGQLPSPGQNMVEIVNR